jgi:hypothetical protein
MVKKMNLEKQTGWTASQDMAVLFGVTELRAHLFLRSDPRKVGISDPDLAESRPDVFFTNI